MYIDRIFASNIIFIDCHTFSACQGLISRTNSSTVFRMGGQYSERVFKNIFLVGVAISLNYGDHAVFTA